MSEVPKFKTIEHLHRLDLIDAELAGPMLNNDPVKFLQLIRKRFIEKNSSDLDINDPLENPVVEAQVALEEAVSYLLSQRIKITNDLLRKYIDEELGYSTGGEAMYRLCKEAGFTKEEFEVWINYDDPSLEDAERFDIRNKLAILNRIYE